MYKENLKNIILGLSFAFFITACSPPQTANIKKMPGVPDLRPYPDLSASLLLDSPIYDFGIKVLSTVTHKKIKITNVGTATAHFLPDITSLYPYSFTGGQFPGEGGSCQSALKSGESCELSVSFNPLNSGEFKNKFILEYKDHKSAYKTEATFSGTGATPAKLVVQGLQSVYDFGSQIVNLSKHGTVTISNEGQAPATNIGFTSASIPFGFEGNEYPGLNATCGQIILAGESCTIKPKFKPIMPGDFTGDIKLSYSNGIESDALNVTVKGTSLSEAELYFIEAPSLSFGSLPVGENRIISVSLVNGGQSKATLLGFGSGLAFPFEFSGGAYPGSGGTCSYELEGGSSCQISLKFTPITSGSFSRNVPFSYNTGIRDRVSALNLTGFGLLDAALSITEHPEYNFGTNPLNTTLEKVFTITNSGGVKATGISLSGLLAPFSFKGGSFPGVGGSCGTELNPSQSCDVVVSFLPVLEGIVSSSIRLNYESISSQGETSLVVKGTGIKPGELVIEQAPIYDFLSTLLNVEKKSFIHITNTGSYSVTLTADNFSAPFSFTGGSFPGTDGSCGTVIEPQASCYVSVSFKPISLGSHSSDLNLQYTTAGLDKVTSISLRGVGIASSELAFLEAPKFVFNSTEVGKTRTATFNLKNSGLVLASGISFSSLSAPFSIKSTTCAAQLLSLFECSITVEFSPSSNQAYSGTLTASYLSNLEQKTTSLLIEGRGVNPSNLAISESPEYNFGDVILNSSASKVFTLSNNGEIQATSLVGSLNSSEFKFVDGSFPGTGGTCGNSLFPGASCTFVVTFHPTTAGNKASTLSISYDGSKTTSLQLVAKGKSPSLLVFADGSSYNFGDKTVDSTTERTVQVINSGETKATLILNEDLDAPFHYVGGTYPGTGGTCSTELEVGATCNIRLSFYPKAPGTFSKTAGLSYFNGITHVESLLTLNGVGRSRSHLVINPASYNFGTTVVGSVTDHSFTLTNTGEVTATALTFTGLALPFSKVSDSCSGGVSPGQSCQVTVSFSPTMENSYSGVLKIGYNDGISVAVAEVPLSATAKNPAFLSFDFSSYDYGEVFLGDKKSKLLNITNTGNSVASGLNLTGVISPYFFTGASFPGTNGTCTSSLSPGQKCAVEVYFQPENANEYVYQLDLQYNNGVNGASSWTKVLGNAKSIAKLMFINASPVDFGTVFVGTTVTKELIVMNNSTAPATSISSSSIFAPFKFVGGSYPGTGGTCGSSLGANSSCKIMISFVPTQVGSFNGELNLSYNNGKSFVSEKIAFTGAANNLAQIVSSVGNSYSFGNVYVDQTSQKTITLTNNGGAEAFSLALSSVNPPYTLVSNNCTGNLAANGSCNFVVGINPANPGSFSQDINLSYNNGAEIKTLTISLSASAIHAPGSIDKSFGTLGYSQVDISSYSGWNISKSFLSADKIISAGRLFTSSMDMMATRMLSSGTSLDTTFNSYGIVTSDLASGSDNANAGAVDSSGNLYLAGQASGFRKLYVAKFTPSGSKDLTFGSGGTFSHEFSTGASKQDMFNDISIYNSNIYLLGSTGANGKRVFVFSKLTSNGLLSSDFASGSGYVKVSFGTTDDLAQSIGIQSSGRLVAAGTSYNNQSIGRIALTRVLSTGSLDTSFGSSGLGMHSVYAGKSHLVKDMKVLSDNKLLVLAMVQTGASSNELVVVKFTSSGGLDTSFNNGMGFVSLGNWGTSTTANYKLEVQADRKIIVAGPQQTGAIYNAAISRLNESGDVDTAFGSNGTKIILDHYSESDADFGLAIQSTGKIVITTRYDNGTQNGILTVRLHP